MKREIKFRAWDGKRMFNPVEFVQDNSFSVGFFEGSGCITREDDPIMQYTGLKDKNGVEIYEGDVVKSNDSFEPIFYISIENYPEEINPDPAYENKKNFHEFIHDVIYSEGHSDLLRCSRNKIEVIGNIYENPELLEK
jgi:uncharacterized phage protein (TIGR01671 family)